MSVSKGIDSFRSTEEQVSHFGLLNGGANAARMKTEPVAPWFLASAQSLGDVSVALYRVARLAMNHFLAEYQEEADDKMQARPYCESVLCHCMHALANITSGRFSAQHRGGLDNTRLEFTCHSDSDDSDVEDTNFFREQSYDWFRTRSEETKCARLVLDKFSNLLRSSPSRSPRGQQCPVQCFLGTMWCSTTIATLRPEALAPIIRVVRNMMTWHLKLRIGFRHGHLTTVEFYMPNKRFADTIMLVLRFVKGVLEGERGHGVNLEVLCLLRVVTLLVADREATIRKELHADSFDDLSALYLHIAQMALDFSSRPLFTEFARYALFSFPTFATLIPEEHPVHATVHAAAADIVCDILEGAPQPASDEARTNALRYPRASASRNPELRIAALAAGSMLIFLPSYRAQFLDRHLDETLVRVMNEYDEELCDEELPSHFEGARAGPEAAPERRRFEAGSEMLPDPPLYKASDEDLLVVLEHLGWFVTRGPKPGYLIFHRPRGPSRRYAHRKIGQETDELEEPVGGNPNFFETLTEVRHYLKYAGVDGVTKTGDIDEPPLGMGCAGDVQQMHDETELFFKPKVWSTTTSAKSDQIDRAAKLTKIYLSLELMLHRLKPKRWVTFQHSLDDAVHHLERDSPKAALEQMLSVVEAGPAHLAMHSLPPRRLRQHLARVFQIAESLFDTVGKKYEQTTGDKLARLLEIVVGDVAMIISVKASKWLMPQLRPLLKLWVDVAQKVAKKSDILATTVVSSSLRFLKRLGFQGPAATDHVSSRLLTTVAVALRSKCLEAYAKYLENDGPRLLVAAREAGGADATAAAVMTKVLAQMEVQGEAAPGLAPPAGASRGEPKCADCNVGPDGLFQCAATGGGYLFHLCPTCYRYRLSDNPKAKFLRVQDERVADARAAIAGMGAGAAMVEPAAIDGAAAARARAAIAGMPMDVAKSAIPVGGGWWQKQDVTRDGLPYYVHEQTGEATWEPPGRREARAGS